MHQFALSFGLCAHTTQRQPVFVIVAEIVPKRILEIMNVQGLTRENIASHLQVRLSPLSSTEPSEM